MVNQCCSNRKGTQTANLLNRYMTVRMYLYTLLDGNGLHRSIASFWPGWPEEVARRFVCLGGLIPLKRLTFGTALDGPALRWCEANERPKWSVMDSASPMLRSTVSKYWMNFYTILFTIRLVKFNQLVLPRELIWISFPLKPPFSTHDTGSTFSFFEVPSHIIMYHVKKRNSQLSR